MQVDPSQLDQLTLEITKQKEKQKKITKLKANNLMQNDKIKK